ncbi:MAG: CDP-diacylglycerol--serine O-phosphatidyltransferase [Chloroherpetonaceae bacterium]|nr:CDP-diacylglycerol--serine O-phosphatidyltransferase [Chloroherpetonaceae bacterium]
MPPLRAFFPVEPSEAERRRQARPKRRFKMKRMQMPRVSRSAVPSTFTVMNMVCGYAAIVTASEGNIIASGWFIIFAALFDTIDGLVARLTNSASNFGVELDSLSDLVSFGAAPAFLAYKCGLESLGLVGVLVSACLMVGSGLRLARFNAQFSGYKEYFSGLPTPSQAMTVAAFSITVTSEKWLSAEQALWTLVGLSIALSLLMISKVRYEKLPKPTPEEFRQRPLKFSLFIIASTAVLIFQAKALLVVMTLYIAGGMLRSLYDFFFEESSTEKSADASAGTANEFSKKQPS